ncbi:hypothetical protein V6N13_124231 [Hibiscus sabdariffa]
MEHHGSICPTPRIADILESSTVQKRKEPAHADGEVAPLPTTTNIDTARRRGKTPAGRIMISDRSSSPEATLSALATELFTKSNQFLVLTYWLQDAKAGERVHKKQQILKKGSCTDAAMDQKTQNPPRQKIEYLPRHLPRQAKKAQKGMSFNQHIFLSIPGLRACLNKAKKTSRAGS